VLKSCPACDHPERGAIEEALARGEPYRELKETFKVPIGQLKRHRKAHAGGGRVGDQETNPETTQAQTPCFLRFGDLPEGGLSYNGRTGTYEEGVAVFRGKKTGGGGYVFELPDGQDEEDTFDPLGACVVLFSYVVAGRQLYEASGTELDEPGILGDPLLAPDSVALEPVSPLARVDFPEGMGPETRKLEEDWGRWRRNDGGRNRARRRGSKGAARPPLGLLDRAARALAEAEARWDPSTALFYGREERVRELKSMLHRS
jgi:hypothetical protein